MNRAQRAGGHPARCRGKRDCPRQYSEQVLSTWLAKPLDAELVATWKRYIQAIWPSLTPHERGEVRKMGLERARTVAEAAGGFLGLVSRISAQEKAVLDDLATLLAG